LRDGSDAFTRDDGEEGGEGGFIIFAPKMDNIAAKMHNI
jgi:hypothetical protein